VFLISGCISQTGKLEKVSIPIEERKMVEVYFCPEDECGDKLAEFLSSANESIHCAFYDLNLKNVIHSLKRNLDVKIVVDFKNKGKLTELNPVYNYGDQLMHNKFCVIDNKIVLTGSFNPTENDNFLNNNNLVVLESKFLSENYEEEFQELFGKKFSGGEKVKYPVIFLGETEIENYFCPEDGCSEKIAEEIGNSKFSVYFMTFSFTDDKIGNILLRLKEDGIDIKGVLEKGQENNYSEYNRLKNGGIDVKLDSNKYNMHHKVFIIDNLTVITGSYNPTKSGDERNDENILIIKDEKIAKKFLKEFEYVWEYDGLIKDYCTEAEDLLISQVYYDAIGKDKDEEFLEIYNPTKKEINLEYYFISNGKDLQRLNGFIKSGEKRKIYPDVSLLNSNGYIILSKGIRQKDFVSWEGLWKLKADKGEVLKRKSFEMANCEEEWEKYKLLE